MRNKAINQTLQKQELNYFSQGNSSQKKTLQTRNSILDYFRKVDKEIDSPVQGVDIIDQKKQNFDNKPIEKHKPTLLLLKQESFSNGNIHKYQSKTQKKEEIFHSFRNNLDKNIKPFPLITKNGVQEQRLERIDFRDYLQKNEKIETTPEKDLKTIPKNNKPKIKKVNEKKDTNQDESKEIHMKFINLLNERDPKKHKNDLIRKSMELPNFPKSIILTESCSNEKASRMPQNEKSIPYTFEQIIQKLIDSKNIMLRELHILKEMKLTQDLDITKANLSNFRVSQREEIMNFIKRKKREYNNKNFDYNSNNMNERVKKKFQQTVYTIMDKLSKLKLSFDEIFSKKIFPKRPFERPFSRDFLECIKKNDVEGMVRFLQKDRFLMYSFDYAKKTALHWAAERHCLYMIYFLINNGAELEAKDMAGRTPLFLAVKNGKADNLDIIKLLLAYGANPYAFSYGKKFASNYTSNAQILSLLKESQKCHLMKDLQPRYNRANFWKSKVEPFFLESSLKKSLESNIYNLYKIM